MITYLPENFDSLLDNAKQNVTYQSYSSEVKREMFKPKGDKANGGANLIDP